MQCRWARPAQPKWQQSQSLLLKLGLVRSQTAPRQHSKSQSLAEKVQLDLLGPEQHARPVPPAATAAMSVGDGEARPPCIAKYLVTATSELAESSGGAGPSWSRAHGATIADVTAAVKSAAKAPPPGEVKYRAATKFEITECSGEFPTFC